MEISAEERVMDLILALANTRRFMTKQQIRESVNGYNTKSDDRAFERMFERDKDLLRQLGIPLVVERGTFDDDVGYRIDLAAYRMDLELTAQEIGLLSLAREVFASSTWRSAAARAVTKVRGLGPAAALDAPLTALDLAVAGEQLDTLVQATAARREVRFVYSPLHGPAAERRVLPWQVVAQHRAWYLIGFDQDRAAQRAFKLSRIVGEVAVGEERAYEVPAQFATRPAPDVDIALAVRPGRATELRRRGNFQRTIQSDDGETRDLIALRAPLDAPLVEELASYGPDAVVLAPPELRAQVLDCFAAAAAVRSLADA